ncbi:MAG: flgL [Hyphomicrobiales bacterium]|nr:flgL [Hyphomicrobiales bacterium]
MVDSVSNFSSSLALRTTITRLQREMNDTRIEASTGKVADRGLTLGLRTSVSVDLQEQVKRIDTIKSMNANVSSRLEATQDTLNSVRSLLSTVMDQFTQARTAGGSMALAQKAAGDALAQLNDKLNASFNGQYLFAGVNTDVKPVSSSPNDPASAGKAAVDASFAAHFGMTQSDPAVANISASDMSAYLSGDFDNLFSDSGWSTNFSAASGKVIQSRVSMSEIVDTSATADGQAFRDITRALTLVAQTGIDKMNPQAAAAVLDKAMQALGAGEQGVVTAQSDLGRVQQRVSDATDRLTIQSQSLAKSIGSLEDVDPYEVSVRLNALSTQIETSYALTSRIQNLSLLKYL